MNEKNSPFFHFSTLHPLRFDFARALPSSRGPRQSLPFAEATSEGPFHTRERQLPLAQGTFGGSAFPGPRICMAYTASRPMTAHFPMGCFPLPPLPHHPFPEFGSGPPWLVFHSSKMTEAA